MLSNILLLVILLAIGYILWNARQADGSWDFNKGTFALLAALATAAAYVTDFFTNMIQM